VDPWPPPNQLYVLPSLVDAKLYLADVNGPLLLAVLVSDEYVMRSTTDDAGDLPPPFQPYDIVPDPLNPRLPIDNGPRTLAVAVSVAKVILSTVVKPP
jgi:hypothetical protein